MGSGMLPGETSCIDYVDDECLEAELQSNRGCHPKVESIFHDKTFRLEAREYVKDNGYRALSHTPAISEMSERGMGGGSV